MSAYNTPTETTRLQGKGDYAILDGVQVKFVSDNLIVFELASDIPNGREYTEINRVLHEGSLDVQKQESGEWKLNWGYSSARRKGSWSSSYRNVSDSVATKIEKAIAAIIIEWIPQHEAEIMKAGILSAQRSIETYNYKKNRLLKELQEIEDKIAAEEEAIANLEIQVATMQEPQETQESEAPETITTVEKQPQPKRTTFLKAATQFYLKGYGLTRNGRKFATADGTETFKKLTDAIAWLDNQPSRSVTPQSVA